MRGRIQTRADVIKLVLAFGIAILITLYFSLFQTCSNKRVNSEIIQKEVEMTFTNYCQGRYGDAKGPAKPNTLRYYDPKVYDFICFYTSQGISESYDNLFAELYHQVFNKGNYLIHSYMEKNNQHYIPVEITTYPVFEDMDTEVVQAFRTYIHSIGKRIGENLPEESKEKLLAIYYQILKRRVDSTVYRNAATINIEYFLEAKRDRRWRQMYTEYDSYMSTDIEKALDSLFGAKLPLSYKFIDQA